MDSEQDNAARTQLTAILFLGCLVAVLAMAACGREQAVAPLPPAVTPLTGQPGATISRSNFTSEPVAIPTPITVSATPASTPVPTGMPEPTPGPSATPTPDPTATSAPTATPEPAPTPSPTPPPTVERRQSPVLQREREYGYTIELPDNWTQGGEGIYGSATPWAQLTISSQMLPVGYTVDQFTQLVQGGLEKDWWQAASLFEVTGVDQLKSASHPAKRIRYRVQESPGCCVLDVAELVMVAQILLGYPHGFRARTWMCEREAQTYAQERDEMLISFQPVTGEAGYYRQFIVANGVTVKADGSVEPNAVEAGADIVTSMLSGREDIARCMARQRAALAIIPRDQTATSLPEFAYLAGTSDFTGRRRDTYEIRGLGGVAGQPVSSAAEEQLLGNWGPQHPYYPYRGLVATHEFAHAIQNLCFTEEHEQWNKFYEGALQAGLYPGTHMMADVMEFFAVLSTAYFEVTDELRPDSDTRDGLKIRFPGPFEALHEIYAGATLPEQYRTTSPHPTS